MTQARLRRAHAHAGTQSTPSLWKPLLGRSGAGAALTSRLVAGDRFPITRFQFVLADRRVCSGPGRGGESG